MLTMRRLWLALTMGLCLVVIVARAATAATVVAASCTNTSGVPNVQTAVTAAVSGDTVSVPAGTCTWSAAIIVPNTKRLIIQGAGVGQTNITCTAVNCLFLDYSDTDVTGFSFTTNGVQIIFARGDGGWRIHHNSFTNTGGNVSTILMASSPGSATPVPHGIGLIDHNTFVNTRILLAQGDQLFYNGTIWNEETGLGTWNSIIIEDNTLTKDIFGNATDSQYSGRYVFRFNDIEVGPTEVHSALNTAPGVVTFGGKSWEMYGNTYRLGGFGIQATYIRAGTGVFFDNDFESGIASAQIWLDNVRSTVASGSCDGTNPRDGNTGSGGSYPAAGYPCRNQIGRGKTASFYVEGSNYPVEALEPAAFWHNRTCAAPPCVLGDTQTVITNSHPEHIANGTDFQNENQTFTGVSGTGTGVVASRPATCTTGVYYWATDEGEWNSTNGATADGRLYKCTAPNTWTLFYTPYQYPHPLTEDDPEPPPPGTPSGARKRIRGAQ